jgi:hypothetical protein
MRPEEIIERDLRFGPFRTEEFRRSVTESLRTAVVNFLVKQVLRYLTVEFSRMDGAITSLYDSPQFVTRPDLTCRYMFELSFHSAEGADYVGGEIIFNADNSICEESHIRPFRIRALNPPPPLSANAPAPKLGICPRCSAPVSKLKSGLGHWTGAKEVRPPPYVNAVPASGFVHYAVCEACGLELATFKVGSGDPDPAGEVWEEDR